MTGLEASRQLAIADHLRVPYAVSATTTNGRLEHVRADAGATLWWPRPSELAATRVACWLDTEGSTRHGTGIPIFARVLDERAAHRLLAELGGHWRPAIAIETPDAGRLSFIWQSATGDLFLPFDPDEVLHIYVSEGYVNLVRGTGRGPGRRALLHSYYRARTVIPRDVQIWLRRHYARIQARTPFPAWPIETALHDFFDVFVGLLAGLAGAPLPYLTPWPHGFEWALVLTHDVETALGMRSLDPILELERSMGVRSSWNFVPGRYAVGDSIIERLHADGFEVGVHGLHHDGRDLASLGHLRKRLPAIRAAAERWNAVGFRSPASHRRWEWMPLLGFDYDSSYPDTDPFEPQRGGCCSWWPFFNRTMVELPLTMPHDHTLFVILGHTDEAPWVEKAEFLRRRQGMALIVTHPDYLVDRRMLASYERFLERYRDDAAAWRALPADVSRWWRRRAATSIRRIDGAWSVIGEAEGEARIALQQPLSF